MFDEQSSDIEFKVFKDKGVVVCKLYDCETIAIRRINKYTRISCYSYNRFDNDLINDVYVGVARCAPEDTFDEEYGKKLALARAKAKRGKAVNNALYAFINDVKKDLERLEKYGIHQIPDTKDI